MTSSSDNHAKIQGPVPAIVKLSTETITVPKSARPIQEDQLKGIMHSIEKIGLGTPITVRRHRSEGHLCVLVAGGHRLEAFKRLGIGKIPAQIIEYDNAKIWTISENLHRVELSRLERAEGISEFAKLCGENAGRSAHPLRGGKQPRNLGNSEAARQLGMDRKQVREARANANITPKAKELLTQNGLDDNQKVLGKVARLKTPESQIAYAKKAARSALAARQKCKASVERSSFSDLRSRWNKLKFRRRFQSASERTRQRFVLEVLKHRN